MLKEVNVSNRKSLIRLAKSYLNLNCKKKMQFFYLLGWRFVTLITMIVASFLGFLSFIFKLLEIILDVTKKRKHLKAISVLSLGAVTLAGMKLFIPCIINISLHLVISVLTGITAYSIENDKTENMYIYDLTAVNVVSSKKNCFYKIPLLLRTFVKLQN